MRTVSQHRFPSTMVSAVQVVGGDKPPVMPHRSDEVVVEVTSDGGGSYMIEYDSVHQCVTVVFKEPAVVVNDRPRRVGSGMAEFLYEEELEESNGGEGGKVIGLPSSHSLAATYVTVYVPIGGGVEIASR